MRFSLLGDLGLLFVLKFFKFLFISMFTMGFIGLCAVIGLYFYVKPELPSVETLRDVTFPQTTDGRVFSEDGKLIARVWRENAAFRLPMMICLKI